MHAVFCFMVINHCWCCFVQYLQHIKEDCKHIKCVCKEKDVTYEVKLLCTELLEQYHESNWVESYHYNHVSLMLNQLPVFSSWDVTSIFDFDAIIGKILIDWLIM